MQSNGANNLILDAGGAAAVTIGNANASSVSICSSATCDTIDIGTNADADTINLGDSNDTVNSPGTLSSSGTISSSGVVNFSGASSVRIAVGAGLSATGTCNASGHAGKVYYANTTAGAMTSGLLYLCDDANSDEPTQIILEAIIKIAIQPSYYLSPTEKTNFFYVNITIVIL